MRHPGVNPYLPLWEYVPDGEPHVFGDRVYLYGSHDRFNGYNFCLNDYVGWSAPVTGMPPRALPTEKETPDEFGF